MSSMSFRVNPHSIVCLNAKELLARSRRHIWNLSDSDVIRTHNHLVRKQTLNHLDKMTYMVECFVMFECLAKWLSVRLRTKWLWVRIPLLSLNTIFVLPLTLIFCAFIVLNSNYFGRIFRSIISQYRCSLGPKSFLRGLFPLKPTLRGSEQHPDSPSYANACYHCFSADDVYFWNCISLLSNLVPSWFFWYTSWT